MAFSTKIKHKIDGRVRLQFSVKDFEQVRDHQAMQQLRQAPGILRVVPNSLTHSILVEASTEERLDQGLQTLVDRQLIEVAVKASADPRPTAKPLADRWKELQQETDTYIRVSTDGALDAKSGAALLFAGLGLSQIFTGNILPAGITLFMYALGAMEISSSKKSEP